MTAHARLHTIVMATDFSANAALALAWAEQLSRQHGARLVLVHASPTERPMALDFVREPLEQDDAVPRSVHAQLRQQAEIARRGGVIVEAEIGRGAAAEVVLATAERRGADLIVAGTHGHTGLATVLFGSTAARLVHDARCPVLTVHPTAAAAPRPIRTVVVPTDFSDDATLAAQAATRVLGAECSGRRLVLLHAYHVAYEARCLPAPLLADAIAAQGAHVNRMLQQRATALRRPGLTVDVVGRDGDPANAILQEAVSSGADLIAMGTRGLSGLDRLLLGSTAERVVASAPCPVLTVRCRLA